MTNRSGLLKIDPMKVNTEVVESSAKIGEKLEK